LIRSARATVQGKGAFLTAEVELNMNLKLFRTLQPARALLGALMLGVGILHFTHAPLFAAIVPDYLPAHLLLVYVSGIAEMALGVLLWFSRTRVLAAWGLMALYVAVFPANLNMALHPDLPLPGITEPPSSLALWLRLPLQLVLLYWAYRYTRPTRY
jgi:uncharacterized membrane protein